MRRKPLVCLPWIRAALLTLALASLAATLDTSIAFRLPRMISSINIPLVAVMAATLYLNPEYGVGFAFVAGFLCDVVLGNSVGARSIPLVVCAVTVGMLQHRLFREHPLTWVLLGFGGSLLHDLVYFCVLWLIGYLPLVYADLMATALAGALANGLLALVCMLPVCLLWRADRRSPASG